VSKAFRASLSKPHNREFPSLAGNSSGTVYGYSVEAKIIDGGGPDVINDQLFSDAGWTRVEFNDDSPIGVPNARHRSDFVAITGYYHYETAQALRWWFVAAAPNNFGLQTRLVKHEIKYTTQVVALKAVSFLDNEEREACMGDWKWQNKLTPDGEDNLAELVKEAVAEGVGCRKKSVEKKEE
jgi:hypothetical protein